MKIEILTGDEARAAGYDLRLDGKEIAWPSDSLVVYAHDDKGIAGRTSLIELPHIEGTAVREDKRNGRLAAQLIATLEETVKQFGRSHIFAFALDDQPEVSDYLHRFGYRRFPVEVFVKNLVEVEQEAA